ncbi:uncharacterized protein LOC5568186 isoform X1 [Aedes aegypti]|uniref:Chitin-binding type-2 domain-containing protein n=1 Tax=Aedes aegypti TaxID=7159 RepID=A0A6I8TD58_AEDAE|nr:uncharacterized protein LOC5568186 isoform X1 [Aedes aegypti]
MKMKLLLLMCCCLVVMVLSEPCPDQTRPHASRCDQYFRCVLLPSKTHVWVPTQCKKGLIYEPQLKTCVLPGDNWECNLSAEEGEESGENVYGINNLPAAIYTGPTGRPVPSTTPVRSMDREVASTDSGYGASGVPEGSFTTEAESTNESETVTPGGLSNLPTVSGDNEGYYIVLDGDGNNRSTFYHTTAAYEVEETEEFSGDGIIEDVAPASGASYDGEMEDKQSSAMLSSEELSKTDLNLFLADYTLQESSEPPSKKNKKKKHPLPPDGKIHPEHLTTILHQQKKLNKYASQIKRKGDPTGGVGNMSPFVDRPVFTSRPEGSVLFNVPQMPQRIPEESHSKPPLMSEDVIRSIIEISKQMMTHQKPAIEEMYVKPIFIPISVSSPSQDFTRLPENPSKIVYHQLFPSLSNHSSQFSSKPIGITITNPYNLGQATVYDNLREQIMNDSMYSNYQSSFMDAYGNRFPMQQQMSNTPMYPYPPPPPMAYPVFSQPQYQYPHPYPNPYYDQSLAMNRLRTSGAYDNDDSQSNENVLSEEEDDASAEVPEKDVPVAVDQQSNEEESEEISEQSGTKKLIAVGGSIMNYKDYKDSILPLLDANPDDVRISVLTCTLGSRQPNKTECTKYYVCNPQNGAFQSFTCPSFTAFNADTRLCDSATYKSCQNAKQTTTTQKATTLSRIAQPTHQTKLTSEANQLKQNLITAHKYIDMIKKQAYKILSRNKITTETPTEQPENDGMIRITAPTMASMVPSITAPTYTTSTTTKRLRAKPKRKHTKKRTSVKSGLHKAALSKASRKSTSSTTSTTSTTTTTTSTTQPPAPKAPKCRKNGKMPDPAVKNNYYVCYKASPKKFIKTRMACPHNLVYCESTGLCTYERKCKRG